LSFTFPLEALLAQRQAIETAKRQRFEHERRRLDETQRRLERLEADFATRVNAWDPNQIRLLTEFERNIAELRAAAQRYKLEVDEARAALMEAMRDRKALELLKKRRFAEYAAREARKEERELDEANQA
jgi:flagellar export protein FliJ